MKIVIPKVEILDTVDNSILKKIEMCGRVCYKSEDKITEDSAKAFVKSIIGRGHESVLEHVNVTCKFTCDRGVSHELVRHRIASYSQESTRYCNYSHDRFDGEIKVVRPFRFEAWNPEQQREWERAMKDAENRYFGLLKEGATPEQARSVLPNSLKTEVIVTANIRSWRHFLRLRTSASAHPDIRSLANMLLMMFKSRVEVLFDDIPSRERRLNDET